MKAIAVVLFSLIAVTTAQEFVAGKTVTRKRRAGRATTVNALEVCRKNIDFATYCTIQEICENPNPAQIFTCMNGVVAIAAKACPATKPYCVGPPGAQICSATQDPLCAPPTICNSPGYYPDPTNCYNYYYCFLNNTVPSAVKFQQTLKECPVGAPFNPAGPQDRKCQVSGTCVRASCTVGQSAEWRAMNYYNFTNNRIAMKCVDSKMDYIHQCGAGLSLDTTYTPYAKCAIQCVTNYQKAVYIGDNTKYYQCLLGKVTVETCEIGQIFNGDSLACEKAPVTTTTAPISS